MDCQLFELVPLNSPPPPPAQSCSPGDHHWSSFWFSNKQHYLSHVRQPRVPPRNVWHSSDPWEEKSNLLFWREKNRDSKWRELTCPPQGDHYRNGKGTGIKGTRRFPEAFPELFPETKGTHTATEHRSGHNNRGHGLGVNMHHFKKKSFSRNLQLMTFQSWVRALLAHSWRNPGTVHWFLNIGLIKQSNTHVCRVPTQNSMGTSEYRIGQEKN